MLQTLDEMKRVLPSDGSFGDFRAFKDLTYMDWVLKEAMRLYNPVPVITRQSTCDTALQGVPIPAGVSANKVEREREWGGGCACLFVVNLSLTVWICFCSDTHCTQCVGRPS